MIQFAWSIGLGSQGKHLEKKSRLGPENSGGKSWKIFKQNCNVPQTAAQRELM